MAAFRIVILVALLPMVQCFNFIKMEEYTSADCDPGNMTYMNVPADNYESDRYGTQAAKGWYTFNGEFPGYTTSLIGVNYVAQDICMKIYRSDSYYKFTCTDTHWTKSRYSDKDCQGEPTSVDSKPLGCTITDEEWSKKGDFISYSKATCNNWIPAIRWTSYKAADCSGEVESSNLDIVYPFGPCMPMGGVSSGYYRFTSDKWNGQINRRRYGSGHGARRRRRAGRFVTYDTLMFTSVDSHTITQRTESDHLIHGDGDEQELSGSLNCDAPDGQENVEETTQTCGQCTSRSSWSEYVMIRGEDSNGGWTDECGQDANAPSTTTTTTTTTTQFPCKGWCADDKNSWSTKCSWQKSCKGCQKCQDHCKPWCKNGGPWSTKCSWKSCRLCTQCNKCRPFCKPADDTDDEAWERKCQKAKCKDCERCKNLAEKAAMSSQGGLRRLEEASSASSSLNALLV